MNCRPARSLIVDFVDTNKQCWGHCHVLNDLSTIFLLQHPANAVLPKRKFPSYKTLYRGSKSKWWSITGECAAHLVNIFEKNKKLRNFLKYTWCSDEFVVATIIMNSDFRVSTVNNNLRYIDWSEQKASPKILRTADFDAINQSKMAFARKFDISVDESILNMIDQHSAL